jgi:hypothetical protein
VTHTVASQHRTAPHPMCLPPAWGSASRDFSSPVLVGLIWTTRNPQVKNGESFRRIQILSLR